jgi:hypothetical protein
MVSVPAESLEFPVFFPVTGNLGREGFPRDWVLRHTVWTAEKFLDIGPKIARNRRDSVIHTFKPDQRNRRAKCNKAALQHFSLEARNSVRFLRGPEANAIRSQIDDSAKRT